MGRRVPCSGNETEAVKTPISGGIRAQAVHCKNFKTIVLSVACELLTIELSTHETIEDRPDAKQSQTKTGSADNGERKNLELQKFGKIQQDDENHCARAPARGACGYQDIGGLREGLFYEKFHQQSRLFWTRALLGVRTMDKAGNVGRRPQRAFLFGVL
jgi:hypothetical protein